MTKTEKKITSRQLIIFFCIFSFSIKFLSLPQILSGDAGRDAWLSALFGGILEFGLLFLALTVLERRQNSDIYTDFKKTTTFAGAKLFALLILTVFIVQIFIIIATMFDLLTDSIFTSLNHHKFIIPLVLLGVMFCFMPSRAIFRSGEIFYILVALGLILSILPALGQMEPRLVTPVLENGLWTPLRGTFRNLIFFESVAFLLIFSGDVEITKHFKRKFMTTASLLSAFFVFFVFMTYSIFGPLSPEKGIAITDLTIYSAFLTQGGRLDWILVCIWLLLLLLRFGVTFFAIFMSVKYILGVKDSSSKGWAGGVGLGIAVSIYLTYILLFKSADRLDAFTTAMTIPIAVLFFVIPIGAFIVGLILFKKEKSNNQTEVQDV